MKKYSLFLFAVLLVFAVAVNSGADKIKRLKTNDESQTVYSSIADGTYHMKGCPLVQGKPTSPMALRLAKERNYKPCEICCYEEVEAPQEQISSEVQVYRASDDIPIIKMNGGFREAKWGVSKEQVRITEKTKFLKADKSNDGLDYLAYRTTQGGIEILLSYYFAESKLVAGRYIFLAEHTNKNLFIDDFYRIKSSISQKYGEPGMDVSNWKNDLYKDDPSEWGMAVSVGHLSYQAVWRLLDTEIILELSGDNFDIDLDVDYASTLPAHEKLRETAKEKAQSGIW